MPLMIETLRQLYNDFNKRNIESVLAILTDDVTWPDMINRRFIYGHVDVRAYWESQWAMIDPHVAPIDFEPIGEDRVRVRVAQTIRDLGGKVLDSSEPVHEYRFEDRLVAQMAVQGEDLER